jgi:hypothetical protein
MTKHYLLVTTPKIQGGNFDNRTTFIFPLKVKDWNLPQIHQTYWWKFNKNQEWVKNIFTPRSSDIRSWKENKGWTYTPTDWVGHKKKWLSKKELFKILL